MLSRWLQAITPKKMEGDVLQGATSVGGPRQVSALVGTSHDPVLTTIGALASTQIFCVDAHPLNPTAGVGNPRRMTAERGALVLAPSDHPAVLPDPEGYKSLRFLADSEIAEEFVKWMLSEPRIARTVGWPITVAEIWAIAQDAFSPATKIVIESRNNFLEALAQCEEVKRTRNKRVRKADGGWHKTTVYRFSAVDDQAAQSERQSQILRLA